MKNINHAAVLFLLKLKILTLTLTLTLINENAVLYTFTLQYNTMNEWSLSMFFNPSQLIAIEQWEIGIMVKELRVNGKEMSNLS